MMVSKRVIQAGNRLTELTDHPPEYSHDSTVLTSTLDQENRLKLIVMYYARRGFAFTEGELCTMAYEMTTTEGRTGFSPIKKKAGRNWLKKGFYKRHPEVRKKMAVNLSIARAIHMNPGQIDKFFAEYRDWIDDWGLELRPNQIWNCDECGVGDVPKERAVVGVMGERAFQTVARDKPENTTVLSFISAGGFACPHSLYSRQQKLKQSGEKQPQVDTTCKYLRLDTSMQTYSSKLRKSLLNSSKRKNFGWKCQSYSTVGLA